VKHTEGRMGKGNEWKEDRKGKKKQNDEKKEGTEKEKEERKCKDKVRKKETDTHSSPPALRSTMRLHYHCSVNEDYISDWMNGFFCVGCARSYLKAEQRHSFALQSSAQLKHIQQTS